MLSDELSHLRDAIIKGDADATGRGLQSAAVSVRRIEGLHTEDLTVSLGTLPGAWSAIVATYLGCIAIWNNPQGGTLRTRLEAAVGSAREAVTEFRKQWNTPADESIPSTSPGFHQAVLPYLLTTLRQVCTALDDLQETFQNLHDAVLLVHPLLADCATDGRRQSTLTVAIFLLRSYFRLRRVGSCKVLARSVDVDPTIVTRTTTTDEDVVTTGEASTTPTYSLSERVVFAYLVGRALLLDNDPHQAERRLQFASDHCGSRRHRTLILTYLIPLKLQRGVYPTEDLWQHHHLPALHLICDSCQNGDVKGFTDALRKNQSTFAVYGTYSLICRAQSLCYRNLIRLLYRSLDAHFEGGLHHRLRLGHIQTALIKAGVKEEDATMDEVECCVNSLIYGGYIKGYLAQKQRIVVLSKQEAFPRPPA